MVCSVCLRVRMVKQEVVDPAYSNSSPPPSSSQVPNGSLLQKVKRAYTRKSNAKPENLAAPAAKVKKVKKEPTEPLANGSGSQTQIGDHMPVQKKKRDRFKGTTEEEVLTRVLPDHIQEDLDILIVSFEFSNCLHSNSRCTTLQIVLNIVIILHRMLEIEFVAGID